MKKREKPNKQQPFFRRILPEANGQTGNQSVTGGNLFVYVCLSDCNGSIYPKRRIAPSFLKGFVSCSNGKEKT
jgi:hypothetical protein